MHANGPVGGEGERWLRSVVENSSEIIKVVDTDGTLRYASPAFKRVLGYDADETVGTMNVLDHVHPEDLPHVLEETEKALVEGGVVTNKVEYRFRHRDGSWKWVESVGTYLTDDPAVGGVVVTVRDISGRKEAEKRVRFQAQLLGAVGEAVIALDMEGRVSYWNRAAEHMYGWSAEEVIGRHLREMVVPEYLRDRAEQIMTEVREKRTWTGEFTVRRKDGTLFPVEATNTPVLGEHGGQVGVISVLKDITERKEAEEALRRSEAELFSVLEGITDGFFALDQEWRFIYVNPQAEVLFDSAREDLIGERIWEDPTFYPQYERAMLEDKTVAFEGYYPPLEKWYSVRAYPSESGLSVYLQDTTEHKLADDKLKKSEARFRSLVQNSYDVITVLDAKGTILYQSPSVRRVLGDDPQEKIGKNIFEPGRIHQEDLWKVSEAFAEVMKSPGVPVTIGYRIRHADGSWRHIDSVGINLLDDPNVGGVVVNFRDVTGRKVAEEYLREAEARYRALVENVPPIVYIQEPIEGKPAAYNVTYMSPRMEEVLGYPVRRFIEDAGFWNSLIHPDDLEAVVNEDERTDRTGEPFRAEYRIFHRDGRLVWVRDEAVLVSDTGSAPAYWQGVISDITEHKLLEERVEHQALHDSLTDLPNRRLFVDRLGHALERTRRHLGRMVGVLFMDLDEFKVVNDSLGHEAGDLLLTVVAQRLGRCLRPEDTLARFGGDEFVVLVEDVEETAEAVRVAERIVEEFQRPFVLDGQEIFASASIGVSLGTARNKSPDDLLRDADTAMYQAKKDGSDYRVFDPAMYERVVRRLELENELRRAVEQEEFVVHYQPIFDFGSQEVWGVEALLRWNHPDRGLLDPSEFVHVSEETGLIIPMGGWVLQEACRQTKEWQRRHPYGQPLGVIVNLSAKQLRHPGCVEAIRAVLANSGLEARSLCLDVTETAFMEVLEVNAQALEQIQALGVRISIDDFGMGYSSLSYLKRLPADILKIAKSFVRGFGKDAEDTAIVRMVIDVAHTLGLKVIAEGVETWAQAALLAETGCDMAQGYHFARPLPPDATSEFLAR